MRRLLAALYMLAAVVLASYLVPALLKGVRLREVTLFQTYLDVGAYAPSAADSWRPMSIAYDHIRSGDPRPVYEAVLLTGMAKFQYPTSSLFPMSLLDCAGVPRERWYLCLNVATLPALLLTISLIVWLALRTAAPPTRRDAWALGLVVALLAALFHPLAYSQQLGQAQVWVNLLAAAMVVGWVLERDAVAGVACGLAMWFKPTLGVMLVWALLRRRPRFAIGALVTVSAGLVAAAALYGAGNLLDYVHALGFLGRLGEANLGNQSVNGLLNAGRAGVASGPGGYVFPEYSRPIHVLTTLSTFLFLALGLLTHPRRGGPDSSARDACLVMALVTISAPIVWRHHLAVLAPALCLGLFQDWRAGRLRRPQAALWAAAYLLCGRPLDQLASLGDTPVRYLVFTGFYGALLAIAALWRGELRKTGQDRNLRAS